MAHLKACRTGMARCWMEMYLFRLGIIYFPFNKVCWWCSYLPDVIFLGSPFCDQDPLISNWSPTLEQVPLTAWFIMCRKYNYIFFLLMINLTIQKKKKKINLTVPIYREACDVELIGSTMGWHLLNLVLAAASVVMTAAQNYFYRKTFLVLFPYYFVVFYLFICSS